VPLFATICALSLAGCGPSKRKQCSELVEVINVGVSSVERGQKQRTNDPTGTVELREMADAMDRAASDAAQVKLDLPELVELSRRYQKMTKTAAEAARDVASSAEKKETEPMKKAQQRLNDALKEEDPILEQLNQFCRP
jgi:hypothetical protein